MSDTVKGAVAALVVVAVGLGGYLLGKAQGNGDDGGGGPTPSSAAATETTAAAAGEGLELEVEVFPTSIKASADIASAEKATLTITVANNTGTDLTDLQIEVLGGVGTSSVPPLTFNQDATTASKSVFDAPALPDGQEATGEVQVFLGEVGSRTVGVAATAGGRFRSETRSVTIAAT